ncbi:MAG: PcfJ domain-containing protein [Lachnospiraceae bacterium]|nr:PcfJ domain-containing protein [Lachnospiraceae bacterium]
MKRKAVEKTEPVKPRGKARQITAQIVQDILVVNLWENKELICRHCINVNTYEYQQHDPVNQRWNHKKFVSTADPDSYWKSVHHLKETIKVPQAAEDVIFQALKQPRKEYYHPSAFECIDDAEKDHNEDVYQRRVENHRRRIKDLMERVPDTPDNLAEWAERKILKGQEYFLKDKLTEQYTCSKCGEMHDLSDFRRTDGGKKIRNDDTVICPTCKTYGTLKKQKGEFIVSDKIMLLQPIDNEISVARHFDVEFTFHTDRSKRMWLNEAVRIILIKKDIFRGASRRLYYNQYTKRGAWSGDGGWDNSYASWGDTNPAQRSTNDCYLWPDGIGEALEHTDYSEWGRVFTQLAAAGKRLDYNRLMTAKNNNRIVKLVELLYKGRFRKLLDETPKYVWMCSDKGYHGPLQIDGQTIEEVFDIKDRQKINRIRDCNGGSETLRWMRWSDRTGEKISQEALEWLIYNYITYEDLEFITDRMSIQQIMNYVNRQRREGYAGWDATTILSQWEDYLGMCERLGLHTDDEMIYRARDLKRRHDEAVEECSRREEELTANDYTRRYPGVERVLQEIRQKYAYENDTYKILVPERAVDVVKEGRALHHCVASSDRYFDRIESHETYICFLRQQTAPEEPFYTIEVEPGGTIRQHRGAYDEEPNIEEIKPFLREWQKEIRKRMKHEDYEREAVSKIKREENIEELRQKNNTRVLEGLMEDFMEAI